MAPSAINGDSNGIRDASSVITPDPLTLDMIPERRAKSVKMSGTVAEISNSDMFKSPGCFLKPKAKRWDHRLSQESLAREVGSLKGAAKYLRDPNIISLGGGLPSSDYFPFDSIDISVPTAPSFAAGNETHQIGKYDIRDGKSLYDLHVSLNYCQAMGSPQLLRWVTEHTELVHNPAYSDWGCALSVGSTAALEFAFRMFCTRGDSVLTEEYTFASAVETAIPLGLRMIGVAVDSEGLLPDSLDDILTTWDPVARNGPKPFVLYTVPTGQNPTGATQSLPRRNAILSIAEKHDLYILEDEPYYFLQMQNYHSSPTDGTASPLPTNHADFLKSLVPSYLHLDPAGRVLRLDSFSKVISPGTRTSWVTGSSQIIERYIRHQEVSVQNPSGISQVILFKLLDEAWGHAGYFDWLIHLRKEYTRRRNVIVRACEKYLSSLHQQSIVTWTPPMAGMFFWLKIDYTKHPLYTQIQSHNAPGLESLQPSQADIIAAIEDKLFLSLVDKQVLVSKGSWFMAEKGTDSDLFFRMTFAAAGEERIVEAVRRFGEGVSDEFGVAVSE